MKQTKHEGKHKFSGVRIAGFFICIVVLNAMLALYSLYSCARVLQYNWQASGADIVIIEVIGMVILAFSPIILTILFNRIIFRIFHGRRRFPRGITLGGICLLLLSQILSVWLMLFYGYAELVTGVGIDGYRNFLSVVVKQFA